MTTPRRLFRFWLVVALTVGLAAWAGRTTWRRLYQLRTSLAAVEKDSFHLSDYLGVPIRNLGEALQEHAQQRTASSRARFIKEANELTNQLYLHKDSFTTLGERQAAGQISAAIAECLARGTNLMSESQLALEAYSPSTQADFNVDHLLELRDKLATAERSALRDSLTQTHESLAWLEGLLVVSWFLLFGLVAVVGLSGYRELLAPLRYQLRKSRALLERHEKLAALGTLAAGVAHEIRNPLTAINVRIHSLKRNLVPGSSEHEDATVVDDEIKRLEGIVQAFLQFARPKEPKFVTVSADSVLTRVRALLGGQLEKAAIELVLESPPDVWIRVDPQQVEQVLINLVQNAAESIETGGTIRLRARSETARFGGWSRRGVVLEVSDTGKGIPPEVQRRLFDPFFTTKEDGTGLGLCIAARIVEQQHGTLHYSTQANRGTTFQILLPAAEHHIDETPTQDSTH